MTEKLDMAGLKAEIKKIKDEARQQLTAKLSAKTKAIQEAIANAVSQKKQAEDEIAHLESALAELKQGESPIYTGAKRGRKPGQKSAAEPKAKAKKGKRIRRSPESLKKSAGEMVAFIKSKGEAGAAKAELEKFGDPTANVIEYVKKWAQAKIVKLGDFGKNVRYRMA